MACFHLLKDSASSRAFNPNEQEFLNPFLLLKIGGNCCIIASLFSHSMRWLTVWHWQREQSTDEPCRSLPYSKKHKVFEIERINLTSVRLHSKGFKCTFSQIFPLILF